MEKKNPEKSDEGKTTRGRLEDARAGTGVRWLCSGAPHALSLIYANPKPKKKRKSEDKIKKGKSKKIQGERRARGVVGWQIMYE